MPQSLGSYCSLFLIVCKTGLVIDAGYCIYMVIDQYMGYAVRPLLTRDFLSWAPYDSSAISWGKEA